MAIKKRIKDRRAELVTLFEDLPEAKKILLRETINTVAFMDVQMADLEKLISSGEAKTPDKQLYTSIAKTRDTLIKRLSEALPAKKTKTLAELLDGDEPDDE